MQLERELQIQSNSVPIHNKPHALKKCCTFHSKPIEEHKTFIKEKNICFRCCGSTRHRAKDCNKVITCKECGSKIHTLALHPGPASWVSEDPADQGEEETKDSPLRTLPSVTSKCTEICGESTSAKSSCKICLVKVYFKDLPENVLQTYVVLDDQSNRSLA